MNKLKSSKVNLFSINAVNFEENALRLFKFQAKNNLVYKQYINHLQVNVNSVDSIFKIPFMPIEFFKHHTIKTMDWEPIAVFESSGTTGQVKSKHFIEDLDYYHQVTEYIFKLFYGDLGNYHFLALLPSYMERENSSLVVMVKNFMEKSDSRYSGFFLNDYTVLIDKIELARQNGKKIILIGVSFALLELAELSSLDLNNVIVMETGGMKGRRTELTREELHDVLKEKFNLTHIHSEYGMTELLSQAYATSEGNFNCPPWMKVIIRNINDPFEMGNQIRSGGVNVIDLANVQSCAFIETQDLGSYQSDDSFKILGRFDNSDIRGCNLLAL